MGKVTLYHPVSLYVLRGALDNCGIKVGKLTQIQSDLSRGTALYRCTIDKLPKELKSTLSVKEIGEYAQQCFARDVTVTSVSIDYAPRKKRFNVSLMLYCDIYQATPLEQAINERVELLPVPEETP